MHSYEGTSQRTEQVNPHLPHNMYLFLASRHSPHHTTAASFAPFATAMSCPSVRRSLRGPAPSVTPYSALPAY